MKRDLNTATLFWIGATITMIVLLASCWDYQITLEQENDRLKAEIAALKPKPMAGKEAYDAVICPSGNSVSQRIDKRRWDGIITRSYWRRVCV